MSIPPDACYPLMSGQAQASFCPLGWKEGGVCPWTLNMQTDITRYVWKRRGCLHCIRKPAHKREHRQAGFIGANAARLRRFMKCRRHRHARRSVRAGLRAYTASLSNASIAGCRPDRPPGPWPAGPEVQP